MVLRITFATTITLACGIIISIYVLLNLQNANLAIALGAFSLIIAFAVIWLGLQSIKNRDTFKLRLRNSTDVIYKSLANHFMEAEAVTGTLYLLEDKLVFQSSFLRSRLKHESIISLQHIKEISFAKTHRAYEKVIVIVTDLGEERFLVRGNQLWIDEIENAIHHHTVAGRNNMSRAI